MIPFNWKISVEKTMFKKSEVVTSSTYMLEFEAVFFTQHAKISVRRHAGCICFSQTLQHLIDLRMVLTLVPAGGL